MNKTFEAQLESIVTEYQNALARSKYDDASDVLTYTGLLDLRTRCLTAIERASGLNSTYYKNVVEIRNQKDSSYGYLGKEVGVASALLSDIRNGYLRSLEEILHGDVFGDFIEMALHLLESGYKDAAAVLAGGTLEIHIKKLCDKHSIVTNSNGKPRKTEELNARLASQNVYTKLDQKNVTAWLGLRNKAAHGQYNEYDNQQVRLFLDSIRNFLTRNPP